MKKQFNFYMDEEVKEIIDWIRKNSPNFLTGMSDSQIVEYTIRSYGNLTGYREKKEPD